MVITISAGWNRFFFIRDTCNFAFFLTKRNLFSFSCRNKLEINIVELGTGERLIIVVFILASRDASHIWIPNAKFMCCFSVMCCCVCREDIQ